MKTVVITGKADKRLLSYPLINLFHIAGRTCLVTDDMNYTRLYDGPLLQGEIEDVQIVITHDIESFDVHSLENDDFDYILYVTHHYIPEGADKVVCLCETTHDFMGTYIEDIKEDNPDYTFLALSSVTPKLANLVDRRFNYLSWKIEHFEYFCTVEETRHLRPMKDNNVNKYLKKLFLKVFEMTARDFDEIIKRYY